MAKKIFGSFLILLFSILIILFFKTGAYKPVTVEKKKAPLLHMYYIKNIGPYHEIVEKIKKVEEIFKNLHIPCTKTFGHFLSDPEIIEHNKLVSHVGCAFFEDETPKLSSLPKEINKKLFGFNLKEKICYNGTFTGSPSLSAIKIYPKLQAQALRDHVKLQTESLEIYYVKGSNVTTNVYLCEE